MGRATGATWRAEVAIPLGYAIVSAAWIALSDRLLGALAPTLETRAFWATAKGLAFVAVTSVVLAVLCRKVLDRERRQVTALARYKLLADHGRDIMLFVSADDGRILEANAAATRAYGYTRDELLGLSIFELRDRATLGATVAQMAEADAAGLWFETVHRRKDGSTFPVEVGSHGATVDGRRVLLSVVRDVTARKQAAAERERLTAALHQAARLEALGRLAGGVAHDFNNLLTVILGCATDLADDCARGGPIRPEHVAELRAAGERARDLTRQLLTFGRRQPAAPEPLDLNDAVRRSERLLPRLLGDGVELAVNLQPGLWTARCDPGGLDQVIVNLAVNARDAMPDGGRIAIETSNFVAGDTLPLGELPPGDYVRLAVRDSGAGMAPEVRERVFEPFFTTKGNGKGTGLGLATAWGVVQQAGGYIRVDSEPGRGSAFEVFLPRADVRGPEKKRAPDREAGALGTGADTQT